MSDPRGEYGLLQWILNFINQFTGGSTTTYLRGDGTFVAPPGSGGGPGGTWVQLARGDTSVTGGTEQDLATVPASGVGTILVPFVCGDGAGTGKIFQGNTGVAAPTGAVVWSLADTGSGTILRARANGSVTMRVVWAIYQFTPAA